MRMKPRLFLFIAMSALGLATTPALSAKIERVDVVKEGIDMTPVVVRANSNGYTSYATASHRYLVRVFAKGKRANHIFWAAISTNKNAHPMTFHPLFYDQRAPNRNDGWGVYKKSLAFHAGVSKTRWLMPPKELCDNNLATQTARGMTKSDVLKREWKLVAHAAFYFVAAADSRSNIKKRKHSFTSVETGAKGVLYPVAVTCAKGI